MILTSYAFWLSKPALCERHLDVQALSRNTVYANQKQAFKIFRKFEPQKVSRANLRGAWVASGQPSDNDWFLSQEADEASGLYRSLPQPPFRSRCEARIISLAVTLTSALPNTNRGMSRNSPGSISPTITAIA